MLRHFIARTMFATALITLLSPTPAALAQAKEGESAGPPAEGMNKKQAAAMQKTAASAVKSRRTFTPAALAGARRRRAGAGDRKGRRGRPGP